MKWIDTLLAKVRLARLSTVQEFDQVLRIEGGAGKRHDEHRELMELLDEKASELLRDHSWVRGWLESQDNYLGALRELAVRRSLIPYHWVVVRQKPGSPESLAMNQLMRR
ncbi:MAG: hypothetical protein ACOY4D_05465 [Pseudomonadota bacterium]